MTNYVNHDDVIAQLQSAGLVVDLPLKLSQGNKSQRCQIDGGDREKRGWYRLYEWVTTSGEIFLTGSYGVFAGDDPGTRKIELTKRCESCGWEMPLREKACPKCGEKTFKKRELSAEEIEAIRARQAEDKKRAAAERGAEIQRAATWAALTWKNGTPATLDSHDYFRRKGLQGAGGTKIFTGVDGLDLPYAEKEDYQFLGQMVGAIMIPMCDGSGRIFGLQFILSRENHKERIQRTERDKEYWPAGLSKDGHYFLIGQPGPVLATAEGYATAQTVHDATGLGVVVTFDAGNQPKVASELRKIYRRTVLLTCADDDWLQKCRECKKFTPVAEENCRHCGKPHGKTNAGVMRAQEAAMLCGGHWVAPKFATERPADKKGPTDFNDLAQAEGTQVVRAQIEAKLKEVGIADPALAAPAAANAAPEGEGERFTKEDRPLAVSVFQTIEDAIERFIPLDDGTGQYLFDNWTNKIALKKQMDALLPAGARWDDVKRHPVWVRRGAYYFDQVGFDPAGTDSDVKLNTWQGWPMKPVRGKCERLVELVEYLCANETDMDGKPMGPEVARWLLRWMAYPLQNPGAKMASAIIMHGPQGTGKSTIFQALAKIYGDYATVLNQRGLEDKFNSDWADCKLFILAEEVVTRVDMWHIKNELKELVTGDTVRVNGKNVAAYPQKNHINLALLSNEDQPLPLENDDRRHLVVYTPPQASEAYYDEVFQEIEEGGIAAFYDYLLHLDLGDFHPKKRPPFTRAKADLISLSQSSEIRFINEWKAGETEFPFCPCRSPHLYQAYLRWCRTNGVRMPRESNQFLNKVKHLPGWLSDGFRVYEDLNYMGEPQKQRMVVPSDTDLKGSEFARKPDEQKTHWLTRCYVNFKSAIETAGCAQ
jgi:putative DNA primase/helicase